MDVTPASEADTAWDTAADMGTVADIRHHDFRFPWATETTVAIHRRISGTPGSILESRVTTGTRVMAAIMGTVGIAHGTTRAISIITRHLPFVTAVTLIMSPATTMCIARATGIVTATDADLVHACGLIA